MAETFTDAQIDAMSDRLLETFKCGLMTGLATAFASMTSAGLNPTATEVAAADKFAHAAAARVFEDPIVRLAMLDAATSPFRGSGSGVVVPGFTIKVGES